MFFLLINIRGNGKIFPNHSLKIKQMSTFELPHFFYAVALKNHMKYEYVCQFQMSLTTTIFSQAYTQNKQLLHTIPIAIPKHSALVSCIVCIVLYCIAQTKYFIEIFAAVIAAAAIEILFVLMTNQNSCHVNDSV